MHMVALHCDDTLIPSEISKFNLIQQGSNEVRLEFDDGESTISSGIQQLTAPRKMQLLGCT